MQNGSLVYAGTYAVSLGSGAMAAVSANLGGSAGLNMAGAGTLLLSGSNVYSGPTAVSSGTLVLGASSAASPNSNYTVTGTKALAFGSGVTAVTIGGLSGTGNFPLSNAGGSGVSLTIGANNASATYTGVVSVANPSVFGAAGSLTKTGSGRECIIVNTPGGVYPEAFPSGLTTVSAGTLEQHSDWASLPAGGASIAAGATLQFDVADELRADTNATISGSGTLLKTGGGFVNLGNGGAVGISMAAGGLIDIENGALASDGGDVPWGSNQASVKIASGAIMDIRAQQYGVTIGALTGSGTVSNSYFLGTDVLTVGAANGSGTFSGAIMGVGNFSHDTQSPPLTGCDAGLTALTKVGTGIEVLSGDNSYMGGTDVEGGTLELLTFDAIPYASGLTVGSNGTVEFGDPSGAGVTMIATRSPAASPAGAVAAVPEPGTLALLFAAGIIAAAALRRRNL